MYLPGGGCSPGTYPAIRETAGRNIDVSVMVRKVWVEWLGRLGSCGNASGVREDQCVRQSGANGDTACMGGEPFFLRQSDNIVGDLVQGRFIKLGDASTSQETVARETGGPGAGATGGQHVQIEQASQLKLTPGGSGTALGLSRLWPWCLILALLGFLRLQAIVADHGRH